jgi:hypothetical protein
MIVVLVWGAPDLPCTNGDHQGVEMKSRRVRVTLILVLLTTALTLSGLVGSGVFGATYEAAFLENADPTDAIKGQVITSAPLNPGGAPVQVQVFSPTEDPVEGLTVTRQFAAGSATTIPANISGNVATTDSVGIAEFPALTISAANEPTFTDYQFEAVVTAPPPVITVAAALAAAPPLSEPFDIWDAGCSSPCTGNLKNSSQSYRATDGLLTLTDGSSSDLPNFECQGYTPILASHVFSHATTGTDPVFVTSKISKAEMKAVANNGQVFIMWCVGLKTEGPWLNNGAPHTLVDANGSAPGGALYVGLAPKCPKTSPASAAPCIVKQKADPAGGNITTGWLPGGDPPRRT